MEFTVYNPDDEIDSFTFCGHKFALKPNGRTTFSDRTIPDSVRRHKNTAQSVVAHLITTLGDWGVTILTGQPTLDAKLIEKAEEKYKAKSISWASDVLAAHARKAKPFTEAGIKDYPPFTEEEKTARRVLEREGLLKVS